MLYWINSNSNIYQKVKSQVKKLNNNYIFFRRAPKGDQGGNRIVLWFLASLSNLAGRYFLLTTNIYTCWSNNFASFLPNIMPKGTILTRISIFSKSRSGHYIMSILLFLSDIGLGPRPLADPWKNCEVTFFFAEF